MIEVKLDDIMKYGTIEDIKFLTEMMDDQTNDEEGIETDPELERAEKDLKDAEVEKAEIEAQKAKDAEKAAKDAARG